MTDEATTMRTGWVNAALEASATPAKLLEAPERQALVSCLRERLGVDVARYWPWQSVDAASVQREDGWMRIAAYVGEAPCLLFLDGADTIWRLASGSDLLRVLEECPLIEFYVCDEAANYLLCHNHHDFVIGWGAASTWVEAMSRVADSDRAQRLS